MFDAETQARELRGGGRFRERGQGSDRRIADFDVSRADVRHFFVAGLGQIPEGGGKVRPARGDQCPSQPFQQFDRAVVQQSCISHLAIGHQALRCGFSSLVEPV